MMLMAALRSTIVCYPQLGFDLARAPLCGHAPSSRVAAMCAVMFDPTAPRCTAKAPSCEGMLFADAGIGRLRWQRYGRLG
jgi:hypothetical protein